MIQVVSFWFSVKQVPLPVKKAKIEDAKPPEGQGQPAEVVVKETKQAAGKKEANKGANKEGDKGKKVEKKAGDEGIDRAFFQWF